jgi:hypothetical protein
MGKKAKEQRAKVEKRNKRVAQEKYAMQNALNKLMKQMTEQQEAESLNVSVGEQEVPFSVVDESELNSIVEFKEQNGKMFEPEFDSAGFSIEEREEIRNVFPANVEGSEEFNEANNK